MSRPLQVRPVDPAVVAAVTTQFQTNEAEDYRVLWKPPLGIRADKPISQLLPGESPDLKNFRIYRKAYAARPPVGRVGSPISTEPILTAAVFVTPENTEILHALTTTGIYELVGSTWQRLTGPTLTAAVYGQYSLTAWNNNLIYSNGFDPIGEVDNQTRTYSELPGAPLARYITTFAGRIVAGNIEGQPARVQWSVRNNNADWVGLGSGFEDLLSTPGGVVDAVRGIFPISDIDALVVRTRSLWLMRQTGDFTAPFSFTKLYDVTGTISPWSLVLTPKGLVGLFRDNVYLVSTSAPPEPIGNQIRDEILSLSGLDFASAAFDVWTWEYCITVPGRKNTTVWRCSLMDEERKWTKDIYGFTSRRVHSAIYRTAITMEELTGRMDTLSGPFELLGLGSQRHGLMFAPGVANYAVMREDETLSRDQGPSSNSPDIPVRADLWSHQLTLTSSFKTIHLAGLLVEYRTTRDTMLQLDYSSDDGQTWSSAGKVDIFSSNVTTPARFMCNINRPKLMLRLRCPDAVGLRIFGAYPRYAEGGDSAD